jgi:hypothetical protein
LVHLFREWIDNTDNNFAQKSKVNMELDPNDSDEWLPEDDLNQNLLGC